MYSHRRAPGLTAKGVAPLLSQVKGKKIERAQKRKTEPLKTPEDIYAAPLSSSEDEIPDDISATDNSPARMGSSSEQGAKIRDVGVFHDPNHGAIDSESESDGGPARGDIKPSRFQAGKPRSAGSTLHNRGSKQEPGPGPLRTRDANMKTKSSTSLKRDHSDGTDDDDARGEPSAKRRASSSRQKLAGGDHLEDDFHQTKVKASQKKYGDRSSKRMIGQSTRSITPDSSLNSPQNSFQSGSGKKAFKAPEMLPPSPSHGSGPSRTSSKFKQADSLPPNPERKVRKHGFRACGPLPEEDSPKRAKFRKPEQLPAKTSRPLRKDDLSVPYVPPQGKPAMRAPGRRKKLRRVESPEKPKSFVAGSTFKLPASLPGMGLDDFLDGPCVSTSQETLSLASDDDDNDDADSELRPIKAVPNTCPMCDLPVDKELLRTFSKGRTLGISQQIRFCRLHNTKSAEDTWLKKGYPEINWDTLPGRFSPHHRSLKRIINGESSHYKSLLADKVSEGKERTLRKTERSLAPGYYGPRGLRIMSEHLISRFASTLRKRAVEDDIVAARGSAVFVSTVLVPELASQLIMEDMGVSVDEARTILEESIPIGDLLHEEIGDVVVDDVEGHDDATDDVFI